MGTVSFTGIMDQHHREFLEEYSLSITDYVNNNVDNIALLGKLVKKDGKEDNNFSQLPQSHIWTDEVRDAKFDDAKRDYDDKIPFLKTISIITGIAAVVFVALSFLALGLVLFIPGIALGAVSIGSGLTCAWKASDVANYMKAVPHQNIARVQYMAQMLLRLSENAINDEAPDQLEDKEGSELFNKLVYFKRFCVKESNEKDGVLSSKARETLGKVLIKVCELLGESPDVTDADLYSKLDFKIRSFMAGFSL